MSGQWKNTFQVKWRIENIRSWLNTRDHPLFSPQFLVATLASTRWKLKLSQKWQLAEKYICLTLERDVDDNNPEPISLNYELSFLAYDGSALKSKPCTMKFAQKTVSQELKLMGLEFLEDIKEAYLPEGALTVCCKLWKAWSTISKRGQCSIRSIIGTKCITMVATIDNFSMIDDNSNVTVNFMSSSPEISFITFNMRRKKNNFVMLERTEVECKCLSSYLCKLFAFTPDGQRRECFDNSCLVSLLTPTESCIINSTYYYSSFLSPEFLKNNTLTLLIEISYHPGVESENIDYDDEMTTDSTYLENVNTFNVEDVHSSQLDCLHQSETENKECDIEKNGSGDEDKCFDAEGKMQSTTTLKEDLRSLYNDRLFCDTKLQTDTETFPAHRSLLSARSPVFKKMFTTDMKEKAGECINVPDLSSDTIRRMLQFLYTDWTGDLEMQSAKDLYVASDKYDITSLKQLCSCFIKKNLCPANVCDIIVLADMHQDKDLESATHEFVLTYDKEVFGSDEWKLFMKNFSSLAAQVMYLKCMKE